MARPSKAGGTNTHKNPMCPCLACKSRRRQAEAIALTAGEGGLPVPYTPPRKTKSPYVPAKINEGPVLHADTNQSMRDRITQWLAMRAMNPKLKHKEAAEAMGIKEGTLQGYIAKAVKEGWLTYDDYVDRLDLEIIPKVLDNLSEFLDKKDRTVTIETAKGTLFKTYQEAKGLNEVTNTILALKIETVDASQAQKVLTGHVVGIARAPKGAGEEDGA